MERRHFISGAVGMALLSGAFKAKADVSQSGNDGLIKPRKLVRGDTIGIIAPGSAVNSPDDYLRVEEVANHYDLKILYAKNVKSGSGYKSRTIRERVDDIHEMFVNKDVAGVFCIRGGYGSSQLLDSISFDLIKRNPKIFIGYSDITAIHLAIQKRTGLVTFHGPVMLSNFSELTEKSFRQNLFTDSPAGVLANPDVKTPVRMLHPVRTITPGQVRGSLTGGNLSLISALMGTRYEIDTRGRIFFIEDVDEPPYKIDRYLTQLLTAGKLSQAAGIVFGMCVNCNTGLTATTWDKSLGEVLDEIIKPLNIPAFYGLAFGHHSDQFTIPYGINAELNANDCSLNITEAACF